MSACQRRRLLQELVSLDDRKDVTCAPRVRYHRFFLKVMDLDREMYANPTQDDL